jgi:putative tricarboxylic transport membrane protein
MKSSTDQTSRGRLRVGTAVVGLAATALAGCGAFDTGEAETGADYPTEPVTLTAPAEPGSGWDTTARALAEAFEKEDLLDTGLPVQNRVGATGCVWLNEMINTYEGASDQIAVTSTPIMSNHLRGDCEPTYEDVTMIASIIVEHYIVVVPADSPYKTADDLLAAIEEDPESVPVAGAGDDQLPFALLVKAAGGDPASVNFIQYEGGGEEITALLNGDVVAAVAGISEFRGQLESGDLHGLTVLQEEAMDPPLDDIPPAPELGYDVTLANWRGIYGPPGMPDDAVTYWQDKLKEVVETPAWEELAQRNQWEPLYLEGEELDSYLAKANTGIEEGLKSTGGVG